MDCSDLGLTESRGALLRFSRLSRPLRHLRVRAAPGQQHFLSVNALLQEFDAHCCSLQGQVHVVCDDCAVFSASLSTVACSVNMNMSTICSIYLEELSHVVWPLCAVAC